MPPPRSPLPRSPLLDRYGPWAVVTGASSGIGQAFARDLGAAGFRLVLVGRQPKTLESLARDLDPAFDSSGGQTRHRVLSADLADLRSPLAIADACADIDVGLLVCSAGFGSSGPFIDTTLPNELGMIDVNCRALTELTWRFTQSFRNRSRAGTPNRRSGMILMSSLVGFQGVPKAATYAATKAFVQSLAEALHHELFPLGIDVIASAPGPIHSGFAARAGMTMGMAQQPSVVARASLRALGRRATVRPGWLAKGLEAALKPLPRFGRVRMMGVVMNGMARRSLHADRSA